MENNHTLIITSTDFKAGDWIPVCCTGNGEDRSPELLVEGISDHAVSMTIILRDMGHPIFPGFPHWVAWNLPPSRCIPGGLKKGAVLEEPFHVEQGIAYGKHGYRGPKPPFHWNHDYKFIVYTLDVKLTLSPNSKAEDVLQAMNGHILQMGELMGKYQKNHK